MKLLIVSDSHRHSKYIARALDAVRDADYLIHLGDGCGDPEEVTMSMPRLRVITVAGNCDYMCFLPDLKVVDIDGHRLFITHGHRYGVKSGYDVISSAALAQKADICLFGHTHHAHVEQRDGLLLMNPGAVSGLPATYGVIELSAGKPAEGHIEQL